MRGKSPPILCPLRSIWARFSSRSATGRKPKLRPHGSWTELQNPQALTIRAGALLGRGKLDEAVAILKLAPPGSMSEAERIRGDVLLKSGKLDEAAATYQAVLSTRAGDLKSLIGLGAIALQRKKLDEAKSFYERAKASHPFDPRPPIGLATTLAQQGKLADAIKELEEIDLRAQTLGTLLTLGRFYLQVNRPDYAVRFLKLVVGQYPGCWKPDISSPPPSPCPAARKRGGAIRGSSTGATQ